MSGDSYDVCVVGAGIAGSATASLLARSGARVALVERHADPAHYKRVCTHYIQSSAFGAIERLGVLERIEAAGGLRTSGEFWTRWGWIRPPEPNGDGPSALNVRREVLDPLLRRFAVETPGVEAMPGERADGLLRDAAGRVAGVETVARDGARRRLAALLTVAADGRDSTVAQLAGGDTRTKPHERFGYFAYYRDLPLATGSRAQMWFMDPEIAYAFPTDAGLTLLACMPTKRHLPEFRADLEGSFERWFESLPDAPPPIRAAQRVSKVIGKLEMPNLRRAPARPGLAFVGDAALASDPLWGVGCGWAFQSAEWLAEAVGPALAGTGDVDAALRRYARRHRRSLRGYEFLNCDYATGRRLNPFERLLFSAAARDQGFAAHFEAFGSRNLPVRRFLGPRSLARAAAINLRYRLRARPGVAA